MHDYPLGPEIEASYPHRYAVVDVETTGLVPSTDRVLQVAVAEIGPRGELIDRWWSYVDPQGPIGAAHIHGITKADLAGAPTFAQVADTIAARLEGRVMVAHNARFDFDMLDAEFGRCSRRVPVKRRLCTRNLAIRLDLPTPDYRLRTVADYFGVAEWGAHDARNDVLTVVEILRHMLVDSSRMGLNLPLARLDWAPAGSTSLGAATNRPPTLRALRSPYVNPGRWRPGSRLVQGMAFVVTGPTGLPRGQLLDRGYVSGLSAMTGFSRKISLVVCNDADRETTGKLKRAREAGVEIITEREFLSLLTGVVPGTMTPAKPAGQPASPVTVRPGPLSGRRVLVLGGVHGESAQLRERISELGGSPRINLTRVITDAVALHGADRDSRWTKAMALGVRWLDPSSLQPLSDPAGSVGRMLDAPPTESEHAVVMVRGQVIDLPGAGRWQLQVSWIQAGSPEPHDVDVVAFATTTQEKVLSDDDVAFFNQPVAADGGLAIAVDTPGEASLVVDLDVLDEQVERVVLAASLPAGSTFSDVGALEVRCTSADEEPFARATLDAATTEQSLHLATLYRRGDGWRLRMVGQGYQFGLADLMRLHGADVEE